MLTLIDTPIILRENFWIYSSPHMMLELGHLLSLVKFHWEKHHTSAAIHESSNCFWWIGKLHPPVSSTCRHSVPPHILHKKWLPGVRGEKNESVGLSLESDSLWVCSQWTVAHQAPPFMEFPRQEYWSGLPFPSPGIVPTQGSNPALLHCRQILYCLSHRSCQMNNCTMMRHCYLNTAKVRGKKWGTVVKGKWRLRYISNFT